MHRCLQIPEIIYLIIDSFSCPSRIVITCPNDRRTPSREHTTALLSLLLTSKSFLEPCLDALWNCMGSARPLLNLMVPPDRQTSAEDICYPTPFSIKNLTQIIGEVCWDRIHYYADRIKGLRVRYHEINALMGRALSTWSSSHDTPLLPNLLYLHWDNSGIGLYPCIKTFSGPSLTTLKLMVGPWPEECYGLIYPVLASLHAACPSLTVLEIEDDGGGTFDGSGLQLSVVLAAFPSITHLGLWIQPSDNALRSLAMMPHLHTIINRTDHVPLVSLTLPSPPFPTLRTLRWTAHEFSNATALLGQLQPTPRGLHGLAIRCSDSTYQAIAFGALLFTVRTLCSADTLTALALENTESPAARALVLPAANVAAALCPFAQMQECRLAGLPIAVDDDLLGALAHAWPALRRLELLAEKPGASQATLAGLHTLAERCPRLAHLEVAVGVWPDGGAGLLPSCGIGHSARRVVAYCADLRALDGACRRRQIAWVRGIFPNAQILLAHAPSWKTNDPSEDILMDLV